MPMSASQLSTDRATDADRMDPAPKPRLPLFVRCLLTIAAPFAAIFSSLLLSLIPGAAQLAEGDNPWLFLVFKAASTSIALASFVILTWVLTRFVDGRPGRAAGLILHLRGVPALLTGVVVAVSLTLIASWCAQVFGLAPTGPVIGRLSAEEWTLILISMLLSAFVMQGIGEELLFRGYLLQSARMRPVPALLISAAVFAAPHLVSNGGQDSWVQQALYIVSTAGLGLLAGILAVHFRSVWAACGVHGGLHVGVFVTDLLGWENSPWVWAFEALLYTAVGVALICLLPREVRARRLDPYV